MTIQITWHLVLMIVVTVAIIVMIFRDIYEGGLDFSGPFWFVVLIILWLIYGGFVWW